MLVREIDTYGTLLKFMVSHRYIIIKEKMSTQKKKKLKFPY